TDLHKTRYLVLCWVSQLVCGVTVFNSSSGCKENPQIFERSDEFKLVGFRDSDWSDDIDDHKSTIRFVFFIGNTTFTLLSRKQPIVTLSIYEVESVVATSCFVESLYSTHRLVAKRILRYLKGTISFGLFYSWSDEFKLVGFRDSDWSGDIDDHKSTIRFVFFIGNTTFTLLSRKQPIITLSIYEVESVAATSCLVGFRDSDWSGDIDDHKSTIRFVFFIGNTTFTLLSRKQPIITLSIYEVESVAATSCFVESLYSTHRLVAKRILRYLKGTISFGLFYSWSDEFKLVGFRDSDWSGDIDDHKSTIRFVFFIGNTTFTLLSRKQPIITLSIYEVESVAATSCFVESLYSTHRLVAKRILRYLKGTISFGLFYSWSDEFKLVGFRDSDWSGDIDDHKSTIRFVFFIGNTTFTLLSRKQPIITLSIYEVESVAATSCYKAIEVFSWKSSGFDNLQKSGREFEFVESLYSTHRLVAKRILRYLKGTISFGLFYSWSDEFKLVGFRDSDWSGDIDDHKSTIRFVFFIGNTTFTLLSRKQPIITLSIYEVESVAATSCVCHAI
ncbi:hypothetical protein V2J09_000325, partial [Rumex salicifolius]